MRRIDPLEIDATYPEALAWFDHQCPTAAVHDGLRFYERAVPVHPTNPYGQQRVELVAVYAEQKPHADSSGLLFGHVQREISWRSFPITGLLGPAVSPAGLWVRTSLTTGAPRGYSKVVYNGLRATLPLDVSSFVPRNGDPIYLDGMGLAFVDPAMEDDMLFDADPWEAESGIDEPPVRLGVTVGVEPGRWIGEDTCVVVALSPYATAVLDRRGIPYDDLRSNVVVRWSKDGAIGDGAYPR